MSQRSQRLVEVWRGTKREAELDRFDLQRRLVTRNMSSADQFKIKGISKRFRDLLLRAVADPALTRDYLLRVSMIGGLRRAEQLG